MWQDFKEAARLSAESKAQSAEAEASTARAKEFRSRAAGLESNDAALTNDVARLHGEVQAGERVLALAKWRSVKVQSQICSVSPAITHQDAHIVICATLETEKRKRENILIGMYLRWRPHAHGGH